MGSLRVGYFGGTFDPPHLGHEILAAEAFFQLDLAKLYWLLTPDPPHKQGNQVTPVADRLAMLELAISRHPGFEISHLDLVRQPPHYAADTVEIIKDQEPDSDLVYLIGEDSLRDLPGWHHPDRLVAAVDQIAVAPRPGSRPDLVKLESALPGITAKLVFLENVMVEISSSLIRDRCRQGEPFHHYLSREVGEFLERKHLYRSSGTG